MIYIFLGPNWANGQPDNSLGLEDKLMLYRNSNPFNPSAFGTWNDLRADCECKNEAFFGTRNFGFICEWENTNSSHSRYQSLPSYGSKKIRLELPTKVKFTLHTHNYQNNVWFDFTTLSNTMKCSCGFCYRYEWEVPYPDNIPDFSAASVRIRPLYSDTPR